MKPFVIDGQETCYAGLIDEKILITATELENGYAEIDGKTVDLSETKSRRRVIRHEEGGYLIISTKHSCAIHPESDEYVDQFLKELVKNDLFYSCERKHHWYFGAKMFKPESSRRKFHHILKTSVRRVIVFVE